MCRPIALLNRTRRCKMLFGCVGATGTVGTATVDESGAITAIMIPSPTTTAAAPIFTARQSASSSADTDTDIAVTTITTTDIAGKAARVLQRAGQPQTLVPLSFAKAFPHPIVTPPHAWQRDAAALRDRFLHSRLRKSLSSCCRRIWVASLNRAGPEPVLRTFTKSQSNPPHNSIGRGGDIHMIADGGEEA
jgi:hypothetical protein